MKLLIGSWAHSGLVFGLITAYEIIRKQNFCFHKKSQLKVSILKRGKEANCAAHDAEEHVSDSFHFCRTSNILKVSLSEIPLAKVQMFLGEG